MSQLKQFPLPDVGEGLTEAEILTWHVSPGDQVEVNQIIVEIETAKAAVELPCPWAGVVAELHARPGETVNVGTPILTIDLDPAGSSPVPVTTAPATAAPATGQPATAEPAAGQPAGAGTSAAAEAASQGKIGEEMPGGRIATLVGYGPRSGAATRRPRKPAGGPPATSGPDGPDASPATSAPSAPEPAQPPSPTPPPAQAPAAASGTPTPPPATAPAAASGTPTPPAAGVATAPAASPTGNGVARGQGQVPLAKPPVRKLAKELGVDLRAVTGSRPDGVITREDVQRAATAPEPVPAEPAAAPTAVPATVPAAVPSAMPSAAPAYDPATREQRVPIRGVRKATAAAVVASAFTAPHVTEFLTVDVTPMMQLRARLKDAPQFRGVKLTPLAFAAKAVCLAARRTPEVNATWDEDAGEIVLKEYVHLGIAAATPRGLVVPKVRDADRKSLRDLALAIEALSDTAREGKTAPADMLGGTFTITNVGVFGVDTGTPIINPGESAILALGAIRDMPWVVDGQIVPRKICQLSLSFDHRLIDGQQGSQFLSDVGALLADPGNAITY